MKKKLFVLSGIVATVAPLMAFAQNATGCANVDPGTMQDIICKIGNILDTVIPILIVLGIVYFVWGVISYVISKDEEAKKRGKDKIIYGIIGLVVIVAMWGLVGIVTKTFGLNGTTNVNVPTLPIN